MKEKTICTCCGCEIPEDEIYYIDGETICQDCVNEECRICEHCGEIVWNDDSLGVSSFQPSIKRSIPS